MLCIWLILIVLLFAASNGVSGGREGLDFAAHLGIDVEELGARAGQFVRLDQACGDDAGARARVGLNAGVVGAAFFRLGDHLFVALVERIEEEFLG